MNRTITITFLFLAACAADNNTPNEAADGGGGGDEPPFAIPACDAACAARAKTNEALTCKHGPWYYRVIRTGNHLEIDCSAGGSFAMAERGSVARRWFETKVSARTTHDLAKEPGEWPLAECFLSLSVYTQVGLNSEPEKPASIEATLSVTPTGASVTSSDPISPNFNFAEGECERRVW